MLQNLQPGVVTVRDPPNISLFDFVRGNKRRRQSSSKGSGSISSIEDFDASTTPLKSQTANVSAAGGAPQPTERLDIFAVASSDPPYPATTDFDIDYPTITCILRKLQTKKPLMDFMALADILHKQGIYYLDAVAKVPLLKRLKGEIQSGAVPEATLKYFYEYANKELAMMDSQRVSEKENAGHSKAKGKMRANGSNGMVKQEIATDADVIMIDD